VCEWNHPEETPILIRLISEKNLTSLNPAYSCSMEESGKPQGMEYFLKVLQIA